MEEVYSDQSFGILTPCAEYKIREINFRSYNHILQSQNTGNVQ